MLAISNIPVSSRVIVAVIVFLIGVQFGRTQNADIAHDSNECRSIPDLAGRERCLEALKVFGDQLPIERRKLRGGWQLVKLPNPSGGEIPSISHAPDLQSSDPNLAGLVLQCAKDRVDVLMVVLEPYPRLAAIDLTTKLGKGPVSKYRGSVVDPGMMIRLPVEAAPRIFDSLPTTEKLHVSMTDGSGPTTSGSVALEGLDEALKILRASCPVP